MQRKSFFNSKRRGVTVVEFLIASTMMLMMVAGSLSLQSHGSRIFRSGMAETEARKHTEMSLQLISRDIRAARWVVVGASERRKLVLQMPLYTKNLVDGLLHAILPLRNGSIVQYELDSNNYLVRTEAGVAEKTRFRLDDLTFAYPAQLNPNSVSISVRAVGDPNAPSTQQGDLTSNQEVFLQNNDL